MDLDIGIYGIMYFMECSASANKYQYFNIDKCELYILTLYCVLGNKHICTYILFFI